MEPKFPSIKVKLIGTDGNVFAVLGRVQKALRTGGATPEQVRDFMAEATSGLYNNVLATCLRWVEVR